MQKYERLRPILEPSSNSAASFLPRGIKHGGWLSGSCVDVARYPVAVGVELLLFAVAKVAFHRSGNNWKLSSTLALHFSHFMTVFYLAV